ncbi:proprotein convertase subtilisin/kexin type 6 isoform X2 [Epinephelus fuscoguttatus]|uniref:proprotein convertase subtilisin/kexin type 6 isoform X2 n=1 Tax=Epinephelus fuscoguttatus TaxID=293821 RepID=UPI0020D02378|nr:proprotein convertase subtilisin/kexin type 6 isoform X2 [Epinephelus fuscoguttatus]
MTDFTQSCAATDPTGFFSPKLTLTLEFRMTLFLLFILLTVERSRSVVSGQGSVYTNHWAVRITGGQEQADRIAAKYGYINFGQIGSLEDHYHFHHSRVVRRAAISLKGPHSFIHMDPEVDWAQQQVVKPRVKRHIQNDPSFIHFNDPKWSNMWYIHCNDKSSRCRSEMNILAAWQRGYTGKNVVVTILDDGIERNHPDLAQNYDHLASYDVNGRDHDPSPRYNSRNENIHGTRCAGEVAAAANNSHCIVGIAYNAHIGGIRMLDGDVTDMVEAMSLGIRPDYIDIYSASWGPKDDGKTVDGPGLLTKKAFEHGIKKGRKGLGSIFVWASGNGGRQGDHCSCDGYTSSIYTISISSTTENGNKPWYLEACSSIMATTYSSGEFHERKIVTTDLRHRCTDGHTGTSVSAPIVAGVIALALEANLLLTWRDVQHLLVRTSRPVHLKADDWKTNAAGLRVSHLYGFGLVDAEAMVLEARRWRTVPPQHTCTRIPERRTRYIHAGQSLNSNITTSGCSEDAEQHVAYLEHVVVKVVIAHPRRGDLEINLISPSGTRSQLLAKRLFDSSSEGFRNWEFMTVHFWGERAEGTWTLEIVDSPSKLRNPEVLGNLKEWTLILYGTTQNPYPPNSAQHSRSRMLEIPDEILEEPELEEEDEYNGPCHSECGDQGCDGPGTAHCLNCVHFSSGSLKSGRTCVSHCPLGHYGDIASHRCRRCYKGCEGCVGRSAGECLSCRRGLYLNTLNSSCSDACPPGYFADENQRQCLKCHDTCSRCLRFADRCTACSEGYSLAGMTCVPECTNGTFFHLEEMTCSPCHSSCRTCTGPGKEECILCAERYLQQEWRCVQTCSPGYYSGEAAGVPHKMCHRCEENCLSCNGPGTTCTRCKEGYSLVSRTCIVNASCHNADEVFCEMVKSNRLCEKKLYRQFCCRTCLMNG